MWKEIYDGYYLISDVGEVIRNWPKPKGYFGKKITPGISNKGYLRVSLQIKGRKFNKFIHSLVAETFIGPCPSGKEVNHKDTNKMNNYYLNLEYITHKENIEHSVSFGLRKGITGPKGETHGASKLTKNNVLEIRILAKKVTLVSLARKFKVSSSTISDVVQGRSWRHL